MLVLRSQGFTLVELIAVLVLVAVLGSVATLRSLPASTFQLQASGDILVAAFFSAQQKAMVQTRPVRLLTGPQSIDIRIDNNADGVFSASESANINGQEYPLALTPGQTLTVAEFDFDRLGKTTAANLVLSQAGVSLTLNVSANGALQR